MVSFFEFSDNIVGILIKKDMDEAIFAEMRRRIHLKFEDYNKLNLFVEIEKGNDISLRSLAGHLYFQRNHNKKFDKIAVVTDNFWVRTVLVIKNILMGTQLKTFGPRDRMKAIQWIAE